MKNLDEQTCTQGNVLHSDFIALILKAINKNKKVFISGNETETEIKVEC